MDEKADAMDQRLKEMSTVAGKTDKVTGPRANMPGDSLANLGLQHKEHPTGYVGTQCVAGRGRYGALMLV